MQSHRETESSSTYSQHVLEELYLALNDEERKKLDREGYVEVPMPGGYVYRVYKNGAIYAFSDQCQRGTPTRLCGFCVALRHGASGAETALTYIQLLKAQGGEMAFLYYANPQVDWADAPRCCKNCESEHFKLYENFRHARHAYRPYFDL